MEGNKAKKKRKKKAAEGDGEKEHKRNWREVARGDRDEPQPDGLRCTTGV